MATYDYWRNALAGTFGSVHDSDPQPGFYRKRTMRSGPFVPVAIWEHDGKMIALVDGKQADADDIWTYVCQHPVTEEAYRARSEGKPWPDEDAAVTESLVPPSVGHNEPPNDEADSLAAQIEAASKNAAEYAEIKDDETAAKAQSARSRLNELSRSADSKREAEKKPHLEAGKNIDAKWQPLVKAAKAAADAIAKALSAHETRKAKAADEARAKAEAERKAALAKQLAAHPEAPQPPAPLPPIPETVAPQPIRGAYGRAATVKVVKIARVTDYDAAYGYLKLHPEMVQLIDRLSQRAVDAGHTVPGVEVSEERKVA